MFRVYQPNAQHLTLLNAMNMTEISLFFDKYFIFIVSPLICGVIGWLTNYLAVKMLFHPKKPINLLLFKIQGIFPKRRDTLARNLAEVVDSELISHQDITEIINDPAFMESFRSIVENYIDSLMSDKIKTAHPMFKMFLNSSMTERIKELFISNLSKPADRIKAVIAEELEKRLDVKDVVQKKIEQLSMDRLEAVLFSILRSEFRFVEFMGGVLGFLIGIFQALLFAL